MIEDSSSGTVDQDELNQWADTYGLTMPVLSDPGASTMWTYASGGSIGLPYKVLYDRGATVVDVGNFSEGDVTQYIRE